MSYIEIDDTPKWKGDTVWECPECGEVHILPPTEINEIEQDDIVICDSCETEYKVHNEKQN